MNNNEALLNTKENRAIYNIGKYYLTHKRNMIYIALEDVPDTDFFWGSRELETFDQLWEDETPIVQIAKDMHRSEISVFLLSFDRIARGLINPREGWKIW